MGAASQVVGPLQGSSPFMALATYAVLALAASPHSRRVPQQVPDHKVPVVLRAADPMSLGRVWEHALQTVPGKGQEPHFGNHCS